ncbi:MAG TPA: metallophosphoesterase [Ruminiclostridium sp.]
MKYLFIIIIFAVILLLYMRIEASLLKKSRINFSTSSKGLKIAHLSDIHIDMLYISTQRLISSLKQINPDIIIMSGDYINKEKDIPKFICLLKQISNFYPVYLSLGNHDHKALMHNSKRIASFINIMQETSATVLLNSNVRLVKNGTTYNIIGIDDLKHGKPDLKKAFHGILPPFKSSCLNVAFSHNPDMVLSLPQEKVDYFLCGHFHGGQIWMPFNLEFRMMRKEKLCNMGYRRGLHKLNGINMYISRGLGNVLFPFRFFSVPEIAIIQLP